MSQMPGPVARNRFQARLLPGRQRLVGRLILLFGGLLIGLLITEVGLRVSGFSHFNPYIVDQDVGYSLRPNAEGWWRREGVTYVRINSQGLRDREHTLAKPPNTIRIAVLGDSFAEALQVPMERAFWAVMEPKLQQCAPPGIRVEVLNFGVSGFSTARELILLRQRVWQYNPDVVLLLVTLRNDIRDNSRALDPYANSGLPYFVYRDGTLTLDDSLLRARNASFTFHLQQSFLGKSLNWLRNHARVVGLIDSAREAYEWRGKQKNTTETSPNEQGLNDEVMRPPVNWDWDQAWKVTEGLILQMREEVKAKGAKFLVVTGSTGIQVSPEAQQRAEYEKRLGVETLFYADLRIKAFGERQSFEVLTLGPTLLDYATRNQIFLHGSGDSTGKGHWNETGHRVAGELIAEKLCTAGFVGVR